MDIFRDLLEIGTVAPVQILAELYSTLTSQIEGILTGKLLENAKSVSTLLSRFLSYILLLIFQFSIFNA